MPLLTPGGKGAVVGEETEGAGLLVFCSEGVESETSEREEFERL